MPLGRELLGLRTRGAASNNACDDTERPWRRQASCRALLARPWQDTPGGNGHAGGRTRTANGFPNVPVMTEPPISTTPLCSPAYMREGEMNAGSPLGISTESSQRGLSIEQPAHLQLGRADPPARAHSGLQNHDPVPARLRPT